MNFLVSHRHIVKFEDEERKKKVPRLFFYDLERRVTDDPAVLICLLCMFFNFTRIIRVNCLNVIVTDATKRLSHG